jgi:AGCS family alanine or glycine:cation symporter
MLTLLHAFALATGLYFSVRTRFFQIRYIRRMMVLLFRGRASGSTMGVKRGIFSNEAGQGTAPHAAAAATAVHPSDQGLVQAFSVYVDTLLVCSATAFMILITGMYKVLDSAGATRVIMAGEGLPPSMNEYGPVYTQMAVDAHLPGFGSAFVALALFFFAFTTIMSYYF